MTPFIYKLTHTPTGRVYIGSRFGKNVTPECFWKTYFTSSKVVEELIKLGGLGCWSWEIFSRPGVSAKAVFKEEHELIAEAMDNLGKERVINLFVHRNGKPSFFNTEHTASTKAKMSTKALKRWAEVSAESRSLAAAKAAATRKASGKPSALLGRPSPVAGIPKSDACKVAMSLARRGVVLPHMVQPKDLEIYEVRNILTGMIVSGRQHDLRALGIDAQEVNNLIKGRVRYSKEWEIKTPSGWSTDRPRAPNPTNALRRTCLHCGVVSTPGNISRWHGNNCKLMPSSLL